MSELVFSACPHDCPSTCALEVERLDSKRIGRVRGAKEQSYTAGVICAKVARYAERVHHPDRLSHPLRRIGTKGSGRFERITWDDALDIVAERFQSATAKHGAEAVWPYYYAGTMGLVQRDGINRLRHVMRYSGQKNTICTTLADAGWLAGAGRFIGPDPREMAEADLIVMWGGNPASTQVNVMHHVSRARKERGAPFVVIDPYRTRTAAVADRHLALRPGTDGALACAVMHVLFRDGFADLDYLAKYTDFPSELRQHLSARDPAWAARITGLTEAEIVDFARLYGRTKKSYIRLGYGFTRSRNGAANMHAALCLPAITGAWLHKGGGAFYSNRDIFHWDKTNIEGLDARDPSVRVLDMSRIGPVLTNDEMDVGKGPPVTAMIIQNCNPVVVAPESNRVRAGFLRDDLFTCVHEQFMTDTARLADLVLPATTFLEHDDIYQGGGHQHIELGPKIIEAHEESRSNHEVLQGLAERLGAVHPGFKMSAIELVDDLLRRSGWPDVAYFRREHWLDCQPDFETSHHLKGFPTKTGKFRFSPDWAALGPLHAKMSALPDHLPIIEETSAEHPFRMIAPPAHNFLNSSFSETATGRRIEARPTALVHPEDCARLGIAENTLVRVGNRRGEVLVHARPFDGMQPGLVVVEGIWPNSDYEQGVGINALIGAEAAPPMGGAAFHDTAVWLRVA